MLFFIILKAEVLDATFDFDTIKNKPAAFIRFFAPWCSHCVQMGPAYKELAETFGADDLDVDQLAVTIAQVDCTQNLAVC